MKRTNYATLIFLATTVVLAVLLFQTKRAEKRSLYDSTTVLNKIVYIQELSLVKYNYAGVISFKDYMKIMNIQVPLTEKFFLLKYNGYIKAGVDFKDAKVKVIGKSVQVQMPKPKLFETVIDEKSIRVFDESMNVFNPLSINDYNQAISKEKSTMTRDAIDQGILQEASEQAHKVVTSMLKDMGFEKIQIDEITTVKLPERR
ncbi:MAG: putative rane protein [Bacteroidetes bacterium]|nr:putative rane protein [Bacteroidota bacterium]